MTTLTRRQMLAASAGLFVAVPDRAAARASWEADLASLERSVGGRLGVCVFEPQRGRLTGHRLDERFALCSTFKLLLAAVVLREAEVGHLDLEARLAYTEADMVDFAPVTRPRLADGGMTIAALAEAAQVASDNVAANLLVRRLGGPAGFTARLRALGDEVTRLDRYEPELNLVRAGEVRDTTTPRAMASTVAGFLAGNWMGSPSRERLASWMVATTTGAKRIRAGLPPGWRAGDKTGTGLADTMTDKVNDVAAVWQPGHEVAIVAAFYDSHRRSAAVQEADQAVLAHVGRLAAVRLQKSL